MQYLNLFPLQDWTLARYIHAYTLVNSRAIDIDLSEITTQETKEKKKKKETEMPFKKSKRSPVVIPIVDLFNHNSELQTTPHFQIQQQQNGKQSFELIAQRSYVKGEEIYLNYGTGTFTSKGMITEQGNGSKGHFIHHYSFWNRRQSNVENNDADNEKEKKNSNTPATANNKNNNNNNNKSMNNEINTVEYLRIALSYVLQHDQSGCSGVTETGVVEHWRKEMLHALKLSSIDQIRISTVDGKIPKEDLILLRAWTICPAYVMQYGTERLTHHLLTATTLLEKKMENKHDY